MRSHYSSISWSRIGKIYTFVYYWIKNHQSTPVLGDQKKGLFKFLPSLPLWNGHMIFRSQLSNFVFEI